MGAETAQLLTTVQIMDRATGKRFVWSADYPLVVFVYPRQEPDTIIRSEMQIPVTYAALNPVNDLISHPFFLSLVADYLSGALFRKS